MLRGHHSSVTSVTFNDKCITSCSDDGTVKLWSLATGAFLQDLVNLNPDDTDPSRYTVCLCIPACC